MQLHNSTPIRYSASMLVTLNGFMVKVHRIAGEKGKETTTKISFFVDKTFMHRPWKLTIEKGMILNEKEFYRLRDGKLKLEEISLTRDQTIKAIALAEAVSKNPFLGIKEKPVAKSSTAVKTQLESKPVIVVKETANKKKKGSSPIVWSTKPTVARNTTEPQKTKRGLLMHSFDQLAFAQ